ncbi:PI-PLC X domain-containing protein 2 [Saitoella coloradoensis]
MHFSIDKIKDKVKDKLGRNDVPVVNDYENWMGGIMEKIGGKRIIDIAMPGTHDSAMHGDNMGHSLGLDAEKPVIDIWTRLTSVPIAGQIAGNVTTDIIKRWSQTQSHSLPNQLSLGMRYLDLRVCWHAADQSFRLTHTVMTKTRVEEELAEVRAWVEAHPNEVVIIDFQHFYGLGEAEHQAFHAMLTQTLGPHLAPRSLISSPIRDYIAANTRIIVLYGDDPPIPSTGERPQGADAIKAQYEDVWPREGRIDSLWVNERTSEGLVTALDGVVNRRPAAADDPVNNDRFWVLQGVMTAAADDIKARPDHTLKEFGAESCNGAVQAKFRQLLTDDSGDARRRAWIMIVDFPDIPNLDWVKDIIMWNERNSF